MKIIYRKNKHNPCHCDNCMFNFYWQPCVGCEDGHPSFWKTVLESPQWKKWQSEQLERGKKGKIKDGKWSGKNIYDMPEVEELGIISQKHFQDFMKFSIK